MRLFRALDLPLAAKWQEQTIPFDWTLTDRARENRPTVRWWWGVRDTDEGNFAICYVCDRRIWPTSWGTQITEVARSAILVHRDLHLMGKLPANGEAIAAQPTES